MKKRINIMIDEDVHRLIKEILSRPPAKPFSRWVNEVTWEFVNKQKEYIQNARLDKITSSSFE